MVRQDPHGGIQHLQLHVQKVRILHAVLRRKHTSSFYLFLLYIRQIDRHSLPGITFFLILPMYLYTADLTFLSYRVHLQCILLRDRTGHQRACNDRPESRQRKRTVNRKPWDRPDILFHYLVAGHLLDRADQCLQSFPGRRRYSDHRRLRKKGSLQFFLNLFFHQLDPFLVNQVTFIKHDNTLLDPKKA